jgi:hypothetical protein
MSGYVGSSMSGLSSVALQGGGTTTRSVGSYVHLPGGGTGVQCLGGGVRKL